MNKLNVALLSSDFLPNIGGVAAHVLYVGRGLADRGNTVVIINPVPTDPGRLEVISEQGLTVYRAGYRPARSRIVSKVRRVVSTVRALKRVRGDLGRVDVLHQHDGPLSGVAVLLSGLSSIWIWTNHTSGFLMDLGRPIKRAMIARIFGRTQGIITVSQELTERTREVFGPAHPIRYISNGVDLDKFTSTSDAPRDRFGLLADDYVVLCPRRMVPKNGVVFLARAAREVVATRPEIKWKFVFVGNEEAGNTDPAYVNLVMRELADSRLSNSVRILGNVPMTDMPALNAAADIIVIPSLIEAVSLSALEALASQRPVVASSVGGLAEVISDGETGYLVPPGDAGAIAAALELTYDDSTGRKSVGAKGRRLAEQKYSWITKVGEIMAFYREAAGTGPNG